MNVFSKLDFTICQGNKDLKRFIELGVNRDRVVKDYSFKFDSLSIQNERDNFENKGKKLIICASTHDPEEKIFEPTNINDQDLISADLEK